MTLSEIINALELLAPPSLQESYDNSRLLTGKRSMHITAALTTLDCTEAVVNEAINRKCNLIIAHHPIVFSGLKSLTGKNYIERTIIMAIKNDIAIYAIHTNLDNVSNGVNYKIGTKLGLQNLEVLQGKSGMLKKLVTYVPIDHIENVRKALFSAGAGKIGKYEECSFSSEGTGTFKANPKANPHVGQIGTLHFEKETKLEVVFLSFKQNEVLAALKAAHPYEEVAYDLILLDNSQSEIGCGMIGNLEKPMDEVSFFKHVAKKMNCKAFRHTATLNRPIQRVAFCGGSGQFLLSKAIAAKADAFITGDFKYHEFFDAENKLVIMDIGHYESEQFTSELLQQYLQEKFPTFAVLLSGVITNPIHYFIS